MRAERPPQQVGRVRRRLQEDRQRRHRQGELDPGRLQRQHALQVVAGDDLVAEVGVGQRPAPQRRRAVGLEADRPVERARRVADFAGRRARKRDVAIPERHLRAGSDEALRDRAADALGAAGHDGYAVSEIDLIGHRIFCMT